MERFNRRNSKSKFPLIVAAIVLSFGGWLIFKPDKQSNSIDTGEESGVFLEIGETRINLDIADTPQERQTGLSGKDSLSPDRGMLFVFESPDFYNFWMKDVKIPLDIIWISENWEIIDIDGNVLPSSYPAIFSSSKPSLYVLEVNGGFSEEHQISVGQAVKLSDSSQDH